MWKVYIHVIVPELCVSKRKKKERRKKEERKKKKKEDEQNPNFHVCFSQLLYGLVQFSGHFYNRIAKAFSL